MINLNMPDFDMGFPIYRKLHELTCKYPEIKYEDTRISAIFGMFCGAIWNGGGMLIGNSAPKSYVQDVVGFFNEVMHVPLRFTATNCLIGENQCYDTYCNMIMEVAHNGKNEVLTASSILENYLRKEYPNYRFCKSIITTKDEPYDASGKYDLVVMRRRMNNNWDYLDTIPMDHRGKIEFLCCDPCPDNCPRIYTHYRDFARAQIEYDSRLPGVPCSMGKVKGPFTEHYTHTLETYISREMIEKNYMPRGFNQFKLSGRTNIGAIIFDIANYYIKPEYRNDIIQALYGTVLGG